MIHAERSHLPAGATIVVITRTVTDHLLDTLARLKQSGHTVTILFVGDNPSPARLAGLSIYSIGGKEAWKSLVDAYGSASDTSSHPEKSSVGLRL